MAAMTFDALRKFAEDNCKLVNVYLPDPEKVVGRKDTVAFITFHIRPDYPLPEGQRKLTHLHPSLIVPVKYDEANKTWVVDISETRPIKVGVRVDVKNPDKLNWEWENKQKMLAAEAVKEDLDKVSKHLGQPSPTVKPFVRRKPEGGAAAEETVHEEQEPEQDF